MSQGKNPLIFYLCLVTWKVNSVDNIRKSLQISHLLLRFSIEQLFSFIVLGNEEGDMSFFKFLFCLYVKLTVFFGKIWSILWLLCHTGNDVLMLGSNGLYRVIKLYEGEKLLFFSLLASSLEMFLTSGNCFSTLLGLWSLATRYFWYWTLRSSNLSSESKIFRNRNPTPLGTFSMLFLGNQFLRSTYVKLSVALTKMFTKIHLYSLWCKLNI